MHVDNIDMHSLRQGSKHSIASGEHTNGPRPQQTKLQAVSLQRVLSTRRAKPAMPFALLS